MVLAFSFGCDSEPQDPRPSAECLQAVPRDRTRHVALDGRAFDVALAGDRYLVATSRGVASVDPCTFEVSVLCHDEVGVRALSVTRERVEYLRHDDTPGTCDLAGGRLDVEPGVAARVGRLSEHGGTRADVRGRVVMLHPVGELPRSLRLDHEALSVALSTNGRELAAGDSAGTVTFFTVPGGLRRDSWQALRSHAYAVAYDHARERILAAGGEGALALRRRAHSGGTPYIGAGAP